MFDDELNDFLDENNVRFSILDKDIFNKYAKSKIILSPVLEFLGANSKFILVNHFMNYLNSLMKLVISYLA